MPKWVAHLEEWCRCGVFIEGSNSLGGKVIQFGCVPKIGFFPLKSSILKGFSIINHPFWGTPNFWKHPFMNLYPHMKIRWDICLQKTFAMRFLARSNVLDRWSVWFTWKLRSPMLWDMQNNGSLCKTTGNFRHIADSDDQNALPARDSPLLLFA